MQALWTGYDTIDETIQDHDRMENKLIDTMNGIYCRIEFAAIFLTSLARDWFITILNSFG